MSEEAGLSREGLNEVYLFHGTSLEIAKAIAVEGFDSRLANEGYYGKGTYFASQACKSHQYRAGNNKGCTAERGVIIVSRVALGNPHYAVQVDKKMVRPPKQATG